jgi:hypothetical protein
MRKTLPDDFILKRRGKDPQELTDLIVKAKQSTDLRLREEARTELVQLYRRSVEGQAIGFVRKGTAGKGHTLNPNSTRMRTVRDDIKQAAWVGFFKALESYDPKSGVPFGGYFTFQIWHQCTREFAISENGVSGTDGEIWRKYLSWCGKNKGLKMRSWEENIGLAAKAIGCTPGDIEAVVRARGASLESFEVLFEGSDPDDRTTWGNYDDIDPEDMPQSAGKATDALVFNDTFNETEDNIQRLEGVIKEAATNGKSETEAARMLIKVFGSRTAPEEIAKDKNFRRLFASYKPKARTTTKRVKKVTAKRKKAPKNNVKSGTKPQRRTT